MNAKDYLNTKERLERLKREGDRADGAIETMKKQFKDKFGFLVDESKEQIENLNEKKEKLEKKYKSDWEKWKSKWEDKLNGK